MFKNIFIFVIGGILFLEIGFEVMAQEIVRKEELLFEEIPLVFSSSKREQLKTEAASNVTILTHKEIVNSGATNLGDILRSVAGVDVREAHMSQHVVGIRGFSDTQHVLVTVDGNNAFMYHANHIFFDWMPLTLEEIERIEIIKGPGAIFYGGNAFSGVINIVTKSPAEIQGAEISLTGGEFKTFRGSFLYGGKYKNLSYSVAAGNRQADEWEKANIPQERDNFRVDYLGIKAKYNINDISSLNFSWRRSDAEYVISRVCQPVTTFSSLKYKRPNFWIRVFHNKHEKTFWGGNYGVKDNNYELEVYKFFENKNSIFTIGGYAKSANWEIEGLKGDIKGKKEKHSVFDYALNMELEKHLSDRFIFTVGGRVEYYTHLNYLALGRSSLIYTLAKNKGFRLILANGYYIPSLFEHTNDGTVYPFALGSRKLDEEKITSIELNHFNTITNKIKLNCSIFYNDYQDLIDDAQLGPQKNIAAAYQIGGELELEYMLLNWLTGKMNYSHQYINRDDFGNAAVDPRNKANLILNANLGRWSCNTTLHYVDKFEEIYLTSNPVFGRIGEETSNVNSYFTLNARIAYKVTDNVELSVSGYNINNDKHYESNTIGWHTGDLIGRKITGNLKCNF